MAKRIGELLVEAKVLNAEQLEQALATQKQDGRKLGQVLVDLQVVTETQLTQALSRQLSVPWVSLYHIEFSRSLLNLIRREVAEKYCLVPIFVRKARKQEDALYVAMDDPTNEHALIEVAKSANMTVRPMIACPSDIRSAIRAYYGGGGVLQESVPRMQAAAPVTPAVPVPESSMRSGAHTPPQSAPNLRAAPPVPPSRASLGEAKARDTVPEAKESAPASLDAPPVQEESPAPPLFETLADDDAPTLEATEIVPKSKRRGPRMVGLTFLDGTTIMLPAAKKKTASRPDVEEATQDDDQPNDQLTARDLISALRAVAHGADASEILGERPPGWEAMFATLLSLMLKKGLIADWEFIEEFRKI